MAVDFRVELHRLCSFPRAWGAEKSLLALQGFHFSGWRRRVRCAFCQAEVDLGQVQMDHLRHHHLRPQCGRGHLDGNAPLGTLADYKVEVNRLCSFLMNKWVHPVDPNGLASSGFYWTGYSDMVRCAFCGLEVSDWELGDTGEEAHETFNAECPLVVGCCAENVALEPRNPEDLVARHLARLQTQVEGERLTEASGGGCGVGVGEAISLALSPAFPQMAAPVLRMRTFRTWPPALHPSPQQLSAAGFFYTGKGDRVVCFQCGGGLMNWRGGQEALAEHAHWFPCCPFVGVASRSSARGADEVVAVAAGAEMLCRECRLEAVGAVALPCGHLTTCASCAPRLQQCSECGLHVQSVLLTYLA